MHYLIQPMAKSGEEIYFIAIACDFSTLSKTWCDKVRSGLGFEWQLLE